MENSLQQAFIRRRLSAEDVDRIYSIPLADEGHGYDRFGMSNDGIATAMALLKPVYDSYFRVTAHDIHNVPVDGPAILAANHSGMLPLDAMMICCDVVWNAVRPRATRMVMDHFVDMLPGVGTFFTRAGGISGARGNCHYLLDHGELLGIFPEGTPGISKPFSKRYQLQEFRIGHAELAIRHQCPVIPIAVVGAEEQWPQVARLPIRLFGAPFLPVPATPLPLPVRYHIYYGEPIDMAERYEASDSLRAGVVHEAAEEVKAAVADLIARGLSEREGVFR